MCKINFQIFNNFFNKFKNGELNYFIAQLNNRQ